MIEPGIYYPEHLTGEQLDLFLANGWYRMGRGIFTTNYIVQDDIPYRVFWLRYHLSKVIYGKNWKQVCKINRRFSTSIQPLKITEELEALYADYKTGINFEPAESIQKWLYEDQTNSIYDTRLMEIREKGQLIAAGIFDKGVNSIAGILNFYHPEYKKYSLGKYLMLLKMEYAKDEGMQWYYPGYIVYQYPKFNYKLFAGREAAEIYIPELKGWRMYDVGLLEKILS
jgi:leucyl-tRNA---protein transferase